MPFLCEFPKNLLSPSFLSDSFQVFPPLACLSPSGVFVIFTDVFSLAHLAVWHLWAFQIAVCLSGDA